jgi:3-oxoacyl-[acyl-carrier protein] reductase
VGIPDFSLTDEVAVVTGGRRGIGKTIALALAGAGAHVAVCDLVTEDGELQHAAEEIQRLGRRSLALQVDTTRKASVEAMAQKVVDQFGRVDILVNNDGAPPLGQLEQFDDIAWDKAVQQNLMSVVRMARQVIPPMRAAGGGRIVNITALSALQPIATFGLSVATWAGVIGFAKTLSLEVGPYGITVNTICPGRISTPRLEKVYSQRPEHAGKDASQLKEDLRKETPLQRIGRPEDVAALVAFIVSSQASFITGVTIQIDGGRLGSLL